jgi:hypothetical protein
VSDPHERLFESLAPPRGGLAGLRARVERDGRRRVRARNLQAVAAVVVVLAVSTWSVFGPRMAVEPLPGLDLAGIGLGMAPSPSETVTVPEDRRHELAVHRVPLEDDTVVFYRIGSLQPESDSAE